jgi:hypothetical protein
MLDGLDQYKAEAQFGKSLREVLTPFQAILQQQGLEAPRAIHVLMNAHQKLTTGPMEQRQAAINDLAKSMGLQAPVASETQTTQTDPQVQALKQQFDSLQQTLTAQQEAALTEARAKASQEVEKFAADPAHAYFNEVQQDIVSLLNADPKLSLQDAYDKAVWANAVTRQKELTRAQTEAVEKANERARLDALPKKKAAGVNVRSRDTQRTPTEPLGAMEDTMKSALADIRSRAAH